MRSRSQVANAFEFARGLGDVKALVNNASAIDSFHPEAPLDLWDDILSTDLLGCVWSTRFGIDALRAGGGGAIVNVSSTSALRERAEGGSPMYDVAKLAVLRLSTRLGFLRQENIRVNCIIPHWIAVPSIVEYVAHLSAEERKERGFPIGLFPSRKSRKLFTS